MIGGGEVVRGRRAAARVPSTLGMASPPARLGSLTVGTAQHVDATDVDVERRHRQMRSQAAA